MCSRHLLHFGNRLTSSCAHLPCHMRRRIHARHMRRRIHACHMRRTHACHMRRRMHACHMRRRMHACHEEEDTCMSYEEEDTCLGTTSPVPRRRWPNDAIHNQIIRHLSSVKRDPISVKKKRPNKCQKRPNKSAQDAASPTPQSTIRSSGTY
jgi:hypothetical protein